MPRALLVKFGAIGDVVMTLPGASALADAGFTIDWLAGSAAAPILRLYPWINVIEVDDRALLRGSVSERARGMLALWRRLRGPYDLCATLYFDPRYKMLTLPVRAQRKVMLSKTDREFMLLPGRHHADEYARILLGRPDGETPWQFAPVPPPALPANPVPRAGSQARIVLVPGGARNMMRDDALRRWPVEMYAALAGLLAERGHEVVLAGGPDDAWVTPHFAALPVVDTIGRLALPETLALFAGADVVCTHDTGPLHLAGLTPAAVLTLFGPTDPHGRLPHRQNSLAVWGGEGFACRPCYDGRDYAPACTNNGCIQQVTPPLAAALIEKLLRARASDTPLAPQVLEPRAATALVELSQ